MIKAGFEKERMSGIGETVLILIFCIVFCFTYYSNEIDPNNHIYAVGQIHEYDRSVFDNSVLNLGSDYSARTFANKTVAALMGMNGGSWADAAVFLLRFDYVLYALVFAYIVKKMVDGPRLLMASILMINLMKDTLGTISHSTNCASSMFLGAALPFSLLAIAVVLQEKKRWNLAWILTSVSAILHIHEGMWGGCAVGVLWIVYCIRNKKIDWRTILGWLVYVPTVFLVAIPGSINDKIADDRMFVQIYAFIRHPIHLVMTSWPKGRISGYAFLLLIPAVIALLIHAKRKDRQAVRSNGLYFGFLALYWLFLFVVQYVGTEVLQSATITSMYVVKGFKFITFIAAFVYLKVGEYYYLRREYLRSGIVWVLMIVGTMGTSLPGIFGKSALIFPAVMLALLAAVSLLRLDERFFQPEKSTMDLLIRMAEWLAIIGAYTVCSRSTEQLLLLLTAYAAVFGREIIRSKAFCSAVVWIFLVGSSVYVLNGRLFAFSGEGKGYISGTDALHDQMGNELYDLAVEFGERTEVNDSFLCDPDDSEFGGWFQVTSGRSEYCNWKEVPSSKTAVMEWYERCVSLKEALEKGPEVIAEYMKAAGTEYLLVRTGDAEVYEAFEGLHYFIGNDTAAVFSLTERQQ